ncbi:MAG TPA: winged helix DNA-binding domain-containing protein [Thermoleophilia bacterium]|nr:winged helix DNA-binding domain-containing protein [Thermoleophilia bacterium]
MSSWARTRASADAGAGFAAPEDVVGWLGAVQAQDYGPAKWAVGMRQGRASDAAVERAFAEGRILRTHVLRPTWHFVLPADIRWLLTATVPRIQAGNAGRYRRLGLDADSLRRSEELLAGALRGGEQLTRSELADVLAVGGVDVQHQRLPHVLMYAELNATICSGARRGLQHTYALLAERAPDALDLPREAALAELAWRFFTSHGPATAKDFATWASLTLADVKASVEAAGSSLRREEIGGVAFWRGAHESARTAALRSPSVRLLQGYDEYIMGYTETKGVLARPGTAWSPATPPVFALVVLLDGRVAGFWKRTLRRDEVVVEAALLEPFDAAQMEELEAEAARYGAFLGLDATVVLAPPGERG